MLASRHWVIALVSLTWLLSTVEAVEVHPPLENTITRALQKPLAVNFQQTPLTEVLQRLATEAGVPFQIEVEALKGEEVSPAEPITFETEAQPIAETLDEILLPLQLVYDTRTDKLVITTRGRQDEYLDQRFFDVSRLVQLIQPRLRSIEVRPITPQGFGSGGGEAKSDGDLSGTLISPGHDDFGVGNNRGGGFGGGGGGFGGGGQVERKPSRFRVPMKSALHRFPAEYVLMSILQENTSGQWADVDGVGGTMLPSSGRIWLRQTVNVQHEAHAVLWHLERILQDPKTYANRRLGEDDVDHERRVKLDRILDTVSDAPAGTMPLEKWIDQNIRGHGVIIRIDRDSIREDGIEFDEVLIHLRPGVSRRKLLNDVFDTTQLSLRYFNKHFTLVSLAKADEALSSMIFDVSELPEAGDMEWLVGYLSETTAGQWEFVDGVGGTASPCGISGLLFVRQTDKVLEEVAERLDDLRRPLEIPTKPLQPQRSRSIYKLPDVVTATDLQAMLPKLVDLPDATWPEDAIQRVGAMLIVQQTEFVHRRIEVVIDTIRQAHDIKPMDAMP